MGLQVTQYSGALGKPCTSITIDRKVLSILHLTCVVLYLVLSSTVDQTVTTVLVQLGTGVSEGYMNPTTTVMIAIVRGACQRSSTGA